MELIWLGFIAVSAVIVYFGYNLSKYGDVIAEKTGLGHVWVGTILLATVTSLPELFAGISASAIAQNADIAVGNSLGSCVFNLAIIAIADIALGRRAILVSGIRGPEILAGFSIVLIAIAGTSIILAGLIAGPVFLNTGLYTPIIFGIYIAGVRAAYLYERRELPEAIDEVTEAYQYEEIPLSTAVKWYLVSSIAVIGAALLLPILGDAIAMQTGLGSTFVGAIFIAFTTSLPEVVVSIAAARIGATGLALANIFGSNMFNIAVLGVDDIFFPGGAILAAASTSNALTAFFAIIMTAFIIAGLNYPFERTSRIRMTWETVGVLILFLINTVILFFA